MNIYNGNSESYFPPQFRYVGFALVIAGGIMLFSMNIFGIGFILIGPMFFLLKTGIRINFTDRTFQEYRLILGLHFGKWVELPEIEYVSVYTEPVSHDTDGQILDGHGSGNIYFTDIIFPEPNRLRVIRFHDKSAAMAAGKILA